LLHINAIKGILELTLCQPVLNNWLPWKDKRQAGFIKWSTHAFVWASKWKQDEIKMVYLHE